MSTASRASAASILRNHFDTEASDAGLRSLDLASAGARGSASYDASAVARVDRNRESGISHQRVRETLQRLNAKHVELLSLAYGNRLRSRDTEDGKKRRAVRREERNWRVRLVELYGPEGLIALASPLARKLFAGHLRAIRTVTMSIDTVDMTFNGQSVPVREVAIMQEPNDALVRAEAGGIIAWLLAANAELTAKIDADARQCLNEALDAFSAAHGAQPAAPRQRSSEKTRTRILALHPEHGQVIGR
jgi:hypothetical protein